MLEGKKMYHDKMNHSNCFKFSSLKGTYLQELQSYIWYEHDCTNSQTECHPAWMGHILPCNTKRVYL